MLLALTLQLVRARVEARRKRAQLVDIPLGDAPCLDGERQPSGAVLSLDMPLNLVIQLLVVE